MIKRVLLLAVLVAAFSIGASGQGSNFGVANQYIQVTVSQLPTASASNKGWVRMVTDGNSTTDCTTGTGSNSVVCFSNGSAWGAGGGGGGAPTGAAGGDLGSTYPNPTTVGAHWTNKALVFGGSPYTVLATDASINCDATGGNVVINLPASTGGGKEYFAVKIDSSAFTCTVTRAGSDTIEGSATVVLLSQFDSLLIRDASAGSWLKVSPKIPGSAGNVIYNTNGSNFGAISGSTADNITSLASANSNIFLVNRAWTSGDVTFAGHAIDATADYTGTNVLENTISGAYIRAQIHSSGAGGAVGNGISHMLSVTSRLLDAATETVNPATLADVEGVYVDAQDTSTSTSAITKYTGFYQQANGWTTNTARIIADHTAFRSDLTLLTGSGTTITKEQQIDVPTRNATTAQVTTSFGANIGRCTHASVYESLIVCSEQAEFQSPIYQTYTMGATSVAPLTASQLYGHFDNDFLADSSVVYNYKSVLTHSNGGTGTSTVYYGKNDNGGSATATKQTVFEAQLASSGAPNTSTKQIGHSCLAAANSSATITNISCFESGTLASGTNSSPAIEFKAAGANSASEFGFFSTPISLLTGNKVQLTADWTCGTAGTLSSCATAATVGSGGGVALQFTLPFSVQNWHVHCEGVVGQATAATANSWNWITTTTGATNVTASYSMNTAATAMTGGATTDTAATTSTTVIGPTWTLGGTGTKMPFHVDIMLEGASTSGTVVALQLVAPTVADVVTIYRGTTCVLE